MCLIGSKFLKIYTFVEIIAMKNGLKPFLLLLCLGLMAEVYACSAFMLKGKEYCVVGFNENWITMPGMVVINARGVRKEGLSWDRMVSPTPLTIKNESWESRYGSVTFNLLSVDMPCYGVNEKGLFVVELFLDKTYSVPEPDRAALFWGQWIQFQLDQYATVAELLANLNQVPTVDWWPTFPGSHLYVSDRDGNTAVIEWIDGQLHLFSGENMPLPVLCNDQYARESDDLTRYVDFGGAETFVPATEPMEGRFAKAAHALHRFDPALQEPMAYGWELLDALNPGNWQLMYDVRAGVLQFRSDKGPEIKYLTLADLDFSVGQPPREMDILSTAVGDALPCFVPLTYERNQTCVLRGFPVGYDNPSFFTTESYVVLQNNLDSYVRHTYPALK